MWGNKKVLPLLTLSMFGCVTLHAVAETAKLRSHSILCSPSYFSTIFTAIWKRHDGRVEFETFQYIQTEKMVKNGIVNYCKKVEYKKVKVKCCYSSFKINRFRFHFWPPLKRTTFFGPAGLVFIMVQNDTMRSKAYPNQ